MAGSSSSTGSSDQLLSRKYDQCLARLIVNGGMGLAVGTGLSVLLFRRRLWPIPMAFGFSTGMSYEQCRQSLSPEANLAGVLVRKSVVVAAPDVSTDKEAASNSNISKTE